MPDSDTSPVLAALQTHWLLVNQDSRLQLKPIKGLPGGGERPDKDFIQTTADIFALMSCIKHDWR